MKCLKQMKCNQNIDENVEKMKCNSNFNEKVEKHEM